MYGQTKNNLVKYTVKKPVKKRGSVPQPIINIPHWTERAESDKKIIIENRNGRK